MKTIIVTRHPSLVRYIIEQGIAPAATPVITHASPECVKGRRVIGVLPLRLAALAEEVVEVPLNIPAELRGKELTIEQVREYAGTPRRWSVGHSERGLIVEVLGTSIDEVDVCWVDVPHSMTLDEAATQAAQLRRVRVIGKVAAGGGIAMHCVPLDLLAGIA